ncbi:PREDICTED: uncharacterized protein LOC104783415 [Camelina sativa]|uniref:Uncharacterized protein LOC104783415 n=1 Tax=Camelina sativa TaxID=90675 RepID=A0ABM0YWG5_CAMSA|nr:PREDICTED: uncharacterized protein LOC104783415 [Camelina sativa]
MEVYIDDMLVKSAQAANHVAHLKQCFDIMNKYSMKLNPAKCTFGVTSGEFLGYLVTKRGIEANPKQISAIINLPSPRNTREVQRLTGRIAALNRFISRSTDKSLPFYQLLRGNKRFEWDETLYLYIAISLSACKLHPYFQSHTVEVLTNQPLLTIIDSPSQSGRLAKWAVELSEYDIEYKKRTCAKSQVLADFLVELSPKLEVDSPPPEIWTLDVDGASSKLGSGADVRLTSTTGEILEQSFSLTFSASNNDAEYEELIAGLILAHGIRVKKIQAYCDSQLVTHQFSGDYAARHARMDAYLKVVRDLSQKFESFEIIKIPRSDNAPADALAMLASTSDPDLRRVILVESIEQPSIDVNLLRLQ